MVVAALSVALVAHFSIKSALDWLLIHEAEVSTMDWAHHIQRNIPTFADVGHAHTHITEFVEETAQFETILQESVTIGNIYQADLINIHCYCILSTLGEVERLSSHLHHHGHSEKHEAHNAKTEMSGRSETLRTNLAKHAHEMENHVEHLAEESHEGHMRDQEWPYASHIQHVLQSRASTSHHEEKTLGGFPIDIEALKQLASVGIYKMRVHHGLGGENPSYVGELFHPMTVNGETNHYLRLLINLDEPAHRFTTFLYSSAAAFALLLGIAFYFPIRRIIIATRQERIASERAHYLANQDSLTGLANRNALQSTVPAMIDACREKQGKLCVILLDVNNFKEINDFYGHNAGDQVLKKIAALIRKHAPEGSFIARTGGDEFAIFTDNTSVDFDELGAKIDSEANVAFDIHTETYKIEIELSKGLARYPEHGKTLNELMQHVNLAMHEGKADKNLSVVRFEDKMAQKFQSRVETLKEFRSAIEQSQIVPFYQPLVSMETGKVEGFEALARWNHPEHGILTPAVFQDALDDTTVSALLGAEMLKLIAADMKYWTETGVDFKIIGFNVSEGDLKRPGFVLDVANAIASSGILPNQLVVEVTENSLYSENLQDGIVKLDQLSELGCRISLDDFGTGFSSITQLKELPYSSVKVDKSFIDNVTENQDDQAIVCALLEMGRLMGFTLVIEGVEKQGQVDLLREFGCNMVQGFFYSKPIPATAVSGFLTEMNGQCEPKKVLAS